MLIRQLELTQAIERRIRRVNPSFIIEATFRQGDGERRIFVYRAGETEPTPEERRKLQRIARSAEGFVA